MKAIIRFTKGYVVVLCELGHILESHKIDKFFSGSMLKADISFRHDGDRFDIASDRCQGAGHEKRDDTHSTSINRGTLPREAQ